MQQRSNQAWVEELRGNAGPVSQRQAYEDLARYLYVVAFNYLRMRQANLSVLAEFGVEELGELAQDFVQETLERLARNDSQLLQRFKGTGRFTSWAAQIARNQVAQELRKSYWVRRDPLPPSFPEGDNEERRSTAETWADDSADVDPAYQASVQQIREILQGCLERLPERYRLAILERIVEDQPAEAVASRLHTTANAVYLLVYRGKRQLRQCLYSAGLDHQVLAVFRP